jgi:hypothetical protein
VLVRRTRAVDGAGEREAARPQRRTTKEEVARRHSVRWRWRVWSEIQVQRGGTRAAMKAPTAVEAREVWYGLRNAP